MAEIRRNTPHSCVMAVRCSCQNFVLGGSVWAQGQKLGGWYTRMWDLQALRTWPRPLRSWERLCRRGWAAAVCAPGAAYLGGVWRDGLEHPGRFPAPLRVGIEDTGPSNGKTEALPKHTGRRKAVPVQEGAQGNQRPGAFHDPIDLLSTHLRARDAAAACRRL